MNGPGERHRDRRAVPSEKGGGRRGFDPLAVAVGRPAALDDEELVELAEL